MEDLPPELLMTIFRFVKKNDLLNICLVSNKFLMIASSSVFWKEVELSKKKLANTNAVEEFFTLERFKGSEFFKLSAHKYRGEELLPAKTMNTSQLNLLS